MVLYGTSCPRAIICMKEKGLLTNVSPTRLPQQGRVKSLSGDVP
jgi:hypothetical protein